MSLNHGSRGVPGRIVLVCGAITAGAGALILLGLAIGEDAFTAMGTNYIPMVPNTPLLFALLVSAMLVVGLVISRVSRTIGNAIDRTQAEHTRAEQTQARLAAIVENSNDAIIGRAIDGTITSWNAAAERLFGYSAAEAVGRSVLLIIPPDLQVQAAQPRAQLASGHAIPSDETERITKDGRRIPVSLSQSVIRDEQGVMIGVSLIFSDITKRKRAEEKLRESEDRYRDLVEHSLDLICTHDLEGRILSVNPWAAKVLGYEQAELVNLNLRDVLGSSVRHKFDGYLAAIRTDGTAQGLMLVQTRAGEKRVWEYNNALRTEGVSTPIVRGMAHDITELKRVERELQHKTVIAQLLEHLARAANEAVSPEAAMNICLRRICEEGKWALGRVAMFAPGLSPHKPDRSQWFCTEPARFDAFMRYSDGYEFMGGPSVFINLALHDQHPVWLPELTAVDTTKLRRLAMAAEAGLKAAFAFPVIVKGEVAAFLEFFATETRQPDTQFINGTNGLASQFARMIERHRFEESRAWLAAIVEHSNDAIIGRAIDGTVTSWNTAAERILGYTAADVIGRDPVEIFPLELRQETAERRKLLRAGQPIPSYESVRIAKDGRRIDMAISGSPIKDNSGNVVGTASILRDITERKRIERELQHKTELAQLLEQLARAANEANSPEAAMEICLRRIGEHGKWAVGRVASFQRAGPRFKAEYSQWFCTEPARFDIFMRYSDGYEFKVGVGKLIGTVLHEQRPVWLQDLVVLEKLESRRLEKAVEAGFKAAFAFPVVVKGEVAAFLEFFATETRQPDTWLIAATNGLASQFAWMIERSRANETQARLAAIVESSNDAIVGRAVDGTVTSWNAAAEHIFGYTAADVIGRDPVEIFPLELRQEMVDYGKLLKAGRKVPDFESVRIAKDGRRVDVAVSVSAVNDDSGRVIGIASLLRDISGRKRTEKMLQASHERLRVLATRLNAAREDESALLAREIHDELGQAVTGMKLDLSWLASRLGQDQHSLQKKIGAMLSNADTAIAAIRNIASRLRPKMLDDLGLVAAIESQARDFGERAGVKCEVVSSLRIIELEPEQSLAVFRITQEALTNIARHAAATRVDISLHEESGDLILEVRDNGKGIRADEIEARNTIGLLGMRERALAAGGCFTIAGFPGRGTVATLRLPIPRR